MKHFLRFVFCANRSSSASSHNILAFVFFPLLVNPMFYALISYFLQILDAVKPYHARVGFQQFAWKLGAFAT